MADLIYDTFMLEEAKGNHDLLNDTLKVILLPDTHTPDSDDDTYSDVSGDEYSTGGGYTAGGATLANVTITESGLVITVDADNITWLSLTLADVRYCIIYNDTHASDGLICLHDFGENKDPTAENFVIEWGATGIFQKEQA